VSFVFKIGLAEYIHWYARVDLSVQLYLTIHEALESDQIEGDEMESVLRCIDCLNGHFSTAGLVTQSFVILQNWVDRHDDQEVANIFGTLFMICQARMERFSMRGFRNDECRTAQLLIMQIARRSLEAHIGHFAFVPNLVHQVLCDHLTEEELAELLPIYGH
jgi:hypothetical protein